VRLVAPRSAGPATALAEAPPAVLGLLAALVVVWVAVAVPAPVPAARVRLGRADRPVPGVRGPIRGSRRLGVRRQLTIRLAIAPPARIVPRAVTVLKGPSVDPAPPSVDRARSSGRVPVPPGQLGDARLADGQPVARGRRAVLVPLAVVLPAAVPAAAVLAGVTTRGSARTAASARRVPIADRRRVPLAEPRVRPGAPMMAHALRRLGAPRRLAGIRRLAGRGPRARVPIVLAVPAPAGSVRIGPTGDGRIGPRTPNAAIVLTAPDSAPASRPAPLGRRERTATALMVAHRLTTAPALAPRPIVHPGTGPREMAGRHARDVMVLRRARARADPGLVMAPVPTPAPAGDRAVTARSAVVAGAAARRGAVRQGRPVR
jgi:hypothetical protein